MGHEVFHTIKHKTGEKELMAIKLDMAKAYDRWVMECVSTPSFSILVNGSPKGLFSPTRILRQETRCRPFCSLLEQICCTEFYSRLNKVDGWMGSNFAGANFTHLLYADDILIFSKASLKMLLPSENVLNFIKGALGIW